jgi:hypothetical protein
MKLHRYATYGFSCGSIDDARALVERAVGIELFERDSSYYGGTYYLSRLELDQSIQLYGNFDVYRSEWIREQYQQHAFVLEVANLDDMDRLRRLLESGVPGIELLKTSVLEVEDDEDEDDD